MEWGPKGRHRSGTGQAGLGWELGAGIGDRRRLRWVLCLDAVVPTGPSLGFRFRDSQASLCYSPQHPPSRQEQSHSLPDLPCLSCHIFSLSLNPVPFLIRSDARVPNTTIIPIRAGDMPVLRFKLHMQCIAGQAWSVTLQRTRSFAACNQHRQSKAQWKPALQHRPYVDLYSLVRCFPAASGSLPKAFTEEQCPRLPSTTPHHCSKTGRATFPSILVFYPIISYRPNLQSISLPLHDSREIICGCSVSGSFPGGRYVSRPSIAALWRSLQSSRLRAHQLLPPSSSCLC